MEKVSPAIRKEFRKFRGPEFFEAETYYLQPFNWRVLPSGKEVLSSFGGDTIVCPEGTVNSLVSRKGDVADDVMGNLYAKHIISPFPISPLADLLAVKYRTRKKFLEEFTGLHIFVITLRCEHTCKYCQVSRVTANKEDFDMSLEHINKFIDMMFRSPNKDLTMEFQGGEPLLAFESIQYAVSRANEIAQRLGKNMTYVVCTNLALLTQEHIEWSKEFDVNWSTSLDGPQHIHDSNRHKPRASSYEKAIAGIELIKSQLGPDKVHALMTTTDYSLTSPRQIVREYEAQGFNSIYLRDISPYGFATKGSVANYQIIDFLDFYKEAFDEIVQVNRERRERPFIEDFARILLTRVLTPFSVGHVDLQSPAGLINGVLLYNYDGDIYAGDEARMLAEMGDKTFRLGNIDEHSYHEICFGKKAKEIAESWVNESLAGCSDCPYQLACGADPIFHHSTQGEAYGNRPKSGFCQRTLGVLDFLLDRMESDPYVKKLLRAWVE